MKYIETSCDCIRMYNTLHTQGGHDCGQYRMMSVCHALLFRSVEHDSINENIGLHMHMTCNFIRLHLKFLIWLYSHCFYIDTCRYFQIFSYLTDALYTSADTLLLSDAPI